MMKKITSRCISLKLYFITFFESPLCAIPDITRRGKKEYMLIVQEYNCIDRPPRYQIQTEEAV